MTHRQIIVYHRERPRSEADDRTAYIVTEIIFFARG